MNWLKHKIKGEKPRIFLGKLAVAPRTDFKKQLDDWSLFDTEDVEHDLHKALTDLFVFPPVASRTSPRESDLVLDVIVPSFQKGRFLPADIPIFWRPKITVAVRLTLIDAGDNSATYRVTEKLEWKYYWATIFSFTKSFSLKPRFSSNDMERLLYKACVTLLERIKTKIR